MSPDGTAIVPQMQSGITDTQNKKQSTWRTQESGMGMNNTWRMNITWRTLDMNSIEGKVKQQEEK